MQTLIELLKQTEDFFKKQNKENPRLEAEKLFAKALKMDRIMLYANYDKLLSEDDKSAIRTLLKNMDNNKEEIRAFLLKSIEYLEKHGVKEAKLISELIFARALKIDRMLLFMSYSSSLEHDVKEKIRQDLKKIAIDKLPYQYIINEQNFYGRDFYIDKGVLIPRYDTEVLVEELLKRVNNNDNVLDIGTGSGVIAITLALENPSIKVLATDISTKAIEIAKKNKKNLNAKNVKIIESDLFDKVEFKKFDIIVSNPPYISNEEIELVSVDTYIHEPHEALFSQSDGLYFYYQITKNASEYLKDNGILAFEIGFNQKNSVVKILEEFKFKNIEVIKDMNKKDRVIIARKENDEA